MNKILETFDSISLTEMKKVRLMNRIDTKYVTTIPWLIALLQEAKEYYFVQEIDGAYMMPYYTLYYDTSDAAMYKEHLRGRKRRQKIRVRRYEASNQSFLEIKNKNNKGRTEKIRIPHSSEKNLSFQEFIEKHSLYPLGDLAKRMENRFSRITLVNKNLTERLTIDIHLRFQNLTTDMTCRLEGLAIIELKRDGKNFSPILDILRRLHIHPAKFSKYCIGMVLTDTELKSNRFKPRLRMIDKMCNVSYNIHF
ncbi:MAG: polyphosphate polymerase domain-containing protein [Parabacteroides sp.]|nr:polyphosphate polymerase domain-containing protein [Parabacteroides sp.]